MELISEFESKLSNLIEQNQLKIDNKKQLISQYHNNEDKEVIKKIIADLQNVSLLEQNLDVLQKYCTNLDMAFLNSYIKQIKIYRGIALEMFLSSNKDILLQKLKKIDKKIIAVDSNQLNNEIFNLQSQVEQIKNLKERIDKLDLTEEDLVNIIALSKTFNIDGVKLILSIVRNSMKNLYGDNLDYEEPVVVTFETNEQLLTDEELIVLFAKYNCNYNILENESKELLKANGNIDNIEQIFKLFQNNGIDLGKQYNNQIMFKIIESNIIQIFIYAQAVNVKEVLDKAKQYDLLLNDCSVKELLKLIEVFLPRGKKYKIISSGDGGDFIPGFLSGRLEDFKQNLDFFFQFYKSIVIKQKPTLTQKELNDGFNKQVFTKCASGFNIKSKTVQNNKKATEVYRIDEGVYITTISALNTISFASKLDEYIEIDCYDYIIDNLSGIKERSVFDLLIYIKQTLNLPEKQIFKINKTKNPLRKKPYKIVLNKTYLQNLYKNRNAAARKDKKYECYVADENKEIFEQLNSTVATEFEETAEDFFKNYSYQEQRIQNKGFDYFRLLENFVDTNNPLIIRIGGVPISRIKVLRVYSVYSNHFKNDSFDRLLYALTYNSHYTKEQVEIITNTLKALDPKGKVNIK